jgi:hypothetical protein
MDDHEFERRVMAAARDHAAKVRRELAQMWAQMREEDAALRRARDAERSGEPAGEPGEDR